MATRVLILVTFAIMVILIVLGRSQKDQSGESDPNEYLSAAPALTEPVTIPYEHPPAIEQPSQDNEESNPSLTTISGHLPINPELLDQHLLVYSTFFETAEPALSGTWSDRNIDKLLENRVDDIRFILLCGHADSVGSDGDNLALSQTRVRAVLNRMKNANSRLGYCGERHPIAESRKDCGANRRVDIVISYDPSRIIKRCGQVNAVLVDADGSVDCRYSTSARGVNVHEENHMRPSQAISAPGDDSCVYE